MEKLPLHKRKKVNSTTVNPNSIVMYVDMNSYFASCEQQDNPLLRGKPVGVLTYNSPYAAVIASSDEAKKRGVQSGMRLNDCRTFCPDLIAVATRPPRYREIHVEIMKILRSYCDDVKARSIDEALMNLTSYRYVYKDLAELAQKIKNDITKKFDYLKCSIGIAPNSFLAKLGSSTGGRNGLVHITPENIDDHLRKLKLTDLPGIASRNERRLKEIGIHSPLEMRHTSDALLRKAFGGIVGHYWHARLNFAEVDIALEAPNRTMSATRTISREQRESRQILDSMLISLCTRLEQRMVKQEMFCRDVSFYLSYRNGAATWDVNIHLPVPTQDAFELRRYILDRTTEYERSRNITTLFNDQIRSMGVTVYNFSDQPVQYSLFDNRIKQDILRKAMYNIKDAYGRNSVRKGAEMLNPYVMRDAIGFGSVQDIGLTDEGDVTNKYLLENEY